MFHAADLANKMVEENVGRSQNRVFVRESRARH